MVVAYEIGPRRNSTAIDLSHVRCFSLPRRSGGFSRWGRISRFRQFDKHRCQLERLSGSIASAKQLLPCNISVWDICDGDRSTRVSLHSLCCSWGIQGIHKRPLRNVEWWSTRWLPETWWYYTGFERHWQRHSLFVWIKMWVTLTHCIVNIFLQPSIAIHQSLFKLFSSMLNCIRWMSIVDTIYAAILFKVTKADPFSMSQ